MPTRPAKPQLAAHLLSDEELGDLVEEVFSTDGVKRRDEEKVIKTGVVSLDRAFGGGIDGGSVVGVWGVEGGGAICRALLADCLLKYQGSTAAVVDTTGNFDVLTLYRVLLARLRDDSDDMASLRDEDAEASVEDVAAKVLDRVKIMRVFDVVGVKEAVDEVRDGLEGRRTAGAKVDVREEVRDEEKQEEAKIVEKQEETETTKEEKEPQIVKTPPKRTEVADSEDEDSDEDMLFDTKVPPTTSQAPASPEPDSHDHHTSNQPSTFNTPNIDPPGADHTPPPQVKFLLVDNLTQVLTPLLKKDYKSAHALTTPFLTTLSNLTRTHSLHTILLNDTNAPRSPSPTRNQGPLPPQPQNKQIPPPAQSIFASRTEVPGLLGMLAGGMDVQVLVGRMPRGRRDARGVVGGNGGVVGVRVGVGGGGKKGVRMAGVMEIMGDRWEGRVGEWGTFVEEEKGIRDV